MDRPLEEYLGNKEDIDPDVESPLYVKMKLYSARVHAEYLEDMIYNYYECKALQYIPNSKVIRVNCSDYMRRARMFMNKAQMLGYELGKGTDYIIDTPTRLEGLDLYTEDGSEPKLIIKLGYRYAYNLISNPHNPNELIKEKERDPNIIDLRCYNIADNVSIRPELVFNSQVVGVSPTAYSRNTEIKKVEFKEGVVKIGG